MRICHDLNGTESKTEKVERKKGQTTPTSQDNLSPRLSLLLMSAKPQFIQQMSERLTRKQLRMRTNLARNTMSLNTSDSIVLAHCFRGDRFYGTMGGELDRAVAEPHSRALERLKPCRFLVRYS